MRVNATGCSGAGRRSRSRRCPGSSAPPTDGCAPTATTRITPARCGRLSGCRTPPAPTRRGPCSPAFPPMPPCPLAPARAAPLAGVRVLDLTRVIAGPVATRTLALLGADVLRVDSPHLPEIAWQHLDTGHGKRSALLDLADASDRARFDALAREADVVVLGYRPDGLARLGLSPADLAARHPGILSAQLSAWGAADRRGFDSIVQAASGIAWIESRYGSTPGALPAQALDHSAGYLLATAVMALLLRREAEGGAWLAETSLRRVAAELLGMPRADEPATFTPVDPAPHTQTFDVEGTAVTTVGPAVSFEGGPGEFAAPRPWGRDEPAWAARE